MSLHMLYSEYPVVPSSTHFDPRSMNTYGYSTCCLRVHVTLPGPDHSTANESWSVKLVKGNPVMS